MRVFLTGGTGFIGSRVAASLLARGDEVVCLVRDPSRSGHLEAGGARLVQGDVTDPTALSRGLEGADAAIHLAAIYDVGVVDERALERVNVGGTQAFLDAITTAGTSKAIHISSTAALGPATNGETDADGDWRGPYPSVYHRTKADAHRLARAAQAAGRPVVIASPAFGYGPGDTGPAGRFVDDLVRGRVPGLLKQPGSNMYVYVDDLAVGVIAALDHAEPGSHYVLGGPVATVNEFAEQVARLAGRRPPPLKMPVWLAAGTGVLLDVVSRVSGARFTVSRESVAVSARLRWVCGFQRTTDDLGWSPRPLAEGLPPTVEYYVRRRAG